MDTSLSLGLKLVFVLALLGFGLAFLLHGEATFAGGIVTAALGLAATILRDGAAKRRSTQAPPDNGEDNDA